MSRPTRVGECVNPWDCSDPCINWSGPVGCANGWPSDNDCFYNQYFGEQTPVFATGDPQAQNMLVGISGASYSTTCPPTDTRGRPPVPASATLPRPSNACPSDPSCAGGIQALDSASDLSNGCCTTNVGFAMGYPIPDIDAHCSDPNNRCVPCAPGTRAVAWPHPVQLAQGPATFYVCATGPPPITEAFVRADLSNPSYCQNLPDTVDRSTATCYFNFTLQNPAAPFIPQDAKGNSLSISDCFCTARVPPQGGIKAGSPTYFLAPPVDDQGLTNVEFFLSPSPNTSCASFADGPADCYAAQDHYCRDESGAIVGLACDPTTSVGQKFGGCVSDGEGGSLQGWQCIAATWDCQAPCSGQGPESKCCVINPAGTGRFESRAQCEASGCTECNPGDRSQCANHGTCNQNVCTCDPGWHNPNAGQSGLQCSCAARGQGGSGNCSPQTCDWPSQSEKNRCGNPGDSFCGQGLYGWECQTD